MVSSSRTVKRRLDEAGLYGRVARKKPLLTVRHKQVRLAWAKERKDWTLHDPNSTYLEMMGEFLCEEELEKTYYRNVIWQTMKFGGGCVMMWGCIFCDGIGPITKVDGRINGNVYVNFLSRHLLPYMQSIGSSYMFMDDNAPCHRSQVVAVQGSEMNGGVATTKS